MCHAVNVSQKSNFFSWVLEIWLIRSPPKIHNHRCGTKKLSIKNQKALQCFWSWQLAAGRSMKLLLVGTVGVNALTQGKLQRSWIELPTFSLKHALYHWAIPAATTELILPPCCGQNLPGNVVRASPADYTHGKRPRNQPRNRWRDLISDTASSNLGVESPQLSEIAENGEEFQVVLCLLLQHP